MPKKSNKTAHVLSLLTNGAADLLDEDSSVPASTHERKTHSDAPKKEVVVELPQASDADPISDLVKSDLQKELDKQLHNKTAPVSPKTPDHKEETDADERLPYSTAFMEKFGLQSSQNRHLHQEALEREIQERIVAEEAEACAPTPSDQIKSELYVLEDFNDEEDTIVSEMKNTVFHQEKDTSAGTLPLSERNRSFLHNFAEDIMIAEAPKVMKSFNMCTCQDCIYEVVTAALNDAKPLYAMTTQQQLAQELSHYEQQYGAELTSELTKACIKVKINPHRPAHRVSPNK
ncbi:late competence development ComFB family protein [Aminipila luticellarii]|uniref:Late competence development protein ComFB n=1 Tax=Aminipila luticellarii TaxID=2507160 RepID=A0A410PST3_9FIRM|nr:late competence development ComFB family protein [Aminipila luticellarii]QAT42037.1 hypothetical protein EQM06_01670 [Aminipila luticellarii]